MCRFITWNRMPETHIKNKLNAYKSELNIQNIYTIHTFIKNINILHNDIKQAGYKELLIEMNIFQKIVEQKTHELLQFHNIR